MKDRIGMNSLRNIVETEVRNLGRKIYGTVSTEYTHSTPVFDPIQNKALMTPEKDQEGYWIGGSSILKDGEEILLYYRLRDPYRRGWKSVIAKTCDGEKFEEINSFTAEEFNSHSLEGGALQKKDGEYILYISYHEKTSGQWKIDRIKSETVEGLNSEKREELDLSTGFTHVKDPVVDGEDLIVHTASKNFTRHGNFRVKNPEGEPEIEKIEFTDESPEGRITSTLQISGEKYYFYDWLPSIIFTGEEKTKIGVEQDGKIQGLMSGRTAIGSSSGTNSLRYVKTVEVNGELWFYYEKSMAGKGHELCMVKMSKQEVKERLDSLKKSVNKEKVE
ncbi:hypothetical protein [Candidatus Nanohalovita haloferacivicina]|uniref:hypothetical protein n=1 Tax=Candidatus Nanohalovita haloferacivicina TaxID=2978046 RepID=UPI00325FB557|nr:hypothetical protein HBNXNv_1031 [Candidatus Nanohalobia archaeon BNXNv]